MDQMMAANFAILGLGIFIAVLVYKTGRRNGSKEALGRVPREPVFLNQFLTDGEAYTTFTKVDSTNTSTIVVLREESSGQWFALRISGDAPPTKFIMAKGKPVAVV